MTYAAFGIASSSGKTFALYEKERKTLIDLRDFEKMARLYQFVINYNDPTLQNRKSHSHYVADIAQDIAGRLGLSASSAAMAGSIGIAHDMGHPPFSHWGETAIKKRLARHGTSWNHDTAGLRVVTDWSVTPENPDGAGLGTDTLEGIAKRFWRYTADKMQDRTYHPVSELPDSILNRDDVDAMHLGDFNHLEGQIAAQSDRIAFNATDIQDGLRTGRLAPFMLEEHFPAAYAVYHKLLNEFIEEYKTHQGHTIADPEIREIIQAQPDVHGVIFERFADAFKEYQINDLMAVTVANLEAGIASGKMTCAGDIRKQDGLTADFSPELHADFRRFAKFCREKIFAKYTAPFEPIVDAMIEDLLDGKTTMAEPYGRRFEDAADEAGKLLVIAEYMTRELTDRDVLVYIQERRPEVYAEYFPGYERVNYKKIGREEAFRRIESLTHAGQAGIKGMPLIDALKDLDFGDANSIEVVSRTSKYLVPLPKEGESIQVGYDGLHRSGEQFRRGEPIYDKNYQTGELTIIAGKGISYYNVDDDQWVAAKTGLTGDDTSLFIINEVNETQALMLDTERAKWANYDEPTIEEIKSFFAYANSMHLWSSMTEEQGRLLEDKISDLCAGHSGKTELMKILPEFMMENGIIQALPEYRQKILKDELTGLEASGGIADIKKVCDAINNAFGGLKNIYCSNFKYTKTGMVDVAGYEQGRGTPYGFKRKNAAQKCRLVRIAHPFELHGINPGSTEKSYEGAPIVNRGNNDIGIVLTSRCLTSYERTDGKKLRLEDIPVQGPGVRNEYQTDHDVNASTMTSLTIVGSGVSGIAAATHIVENFTMQKLTGHSLTLTFIDPAAQPGGATYNRPDANIVGMANPIRMLGILEAEGCVDCLNQDPDHWGQLMPPLQESFAREGKADPNTIITHNQYGMYLRHHLAALRDRIQEQKLPVQIRYVQDTVIHSGATASSATVRLKGGETLEADATIYCVGNAVPRPVPVMGSSTEFLDGRNGYYRLDDQAHAAGNKKGPSDEMTILGTANGALFGVLWAVGNGNEGKFLLTSNTGTLPRVAGVSRPYDRQILTLDNIKAKAEGKVTADLLMRLFREEWSLAVRNGGTWRDIVDSMAPDTNEIWRMMDEGEQKTFSQKYGKLWGNARYRIPNHHWNEIKKLVAEGRVEITGGLKGIVPGEDRGFDIHLVRDDGTVAVRKTSMIVNNTGPSKRPQEMPVCIQNLVEQGDARLHHAGGIDVDNEFRLVRSSGESAERLYAIGPIVSGAFAEAVTVPAIRGNAAVFARTFIKDCVMPKQVERQKKLDALKYQYGAPSAEEIIRYVSNMIETGQTGDPRDPNVPGVTTTADIYTVAHDRNGDRVYDDERTKLHDRIIANALDGKAPDLEDQPSFICVAGGMSVGMTYMQRLMMHENVVSKDNTVVISPLCFLPMHEFAIRNHYQHPEKSGLLVDEYYDVTRKIIAAAIERGLNVVFVDQANDKEPILRAEMMARDAGYETAMMALTMTPEAYYDASELWLKKFNRITDHHRGYRDLKMFAKHWEEFKAAFGMASLFETYFHVADIDKHQDDVSRREYTVKRIETAVHGVSHVNLPQRMQDFIERGLYLNMDAWTPDEARRDYPYADRLQLPDGIRNASNDNIVDEWSIGGRGSLSDRLLEFQSGNFEQKFVSLVQKTSGYRAKRAQEEAARAAGMALTPDLL